MLQRSFWEEEDMKNLIKEYQKKFGERPAIDLGNKILIAKVDRFKEQIRHAIKTNRKIDPCDSNYDYWLNYDNWKE